MCAKYTSVRFQEAFTKISPLAQKYCILHYSYIWGVHIVPVAAFWTQSTMVVARCRRRSLSEPVHRACGLPASASRCPFGSGVACPGVQLFMYKRMLSHIEADLLQGQALRFVWPWSRNTAGVEITAFVSSLAHQQPSMMASLAFTVTGLCVSAPLEP